MSKLSLLSSRQSGLGSGLKSKRHIVALSGGLSSAWVAAWVNENIDGEIIYYFNDTRWEHPDLYRFLDDIKIKLNIDIYTDNDGRSPEDVFYDKKMLGSNRAPICSRVLKAEKLQSFVGNGDTLYFGIDISELHRAARITPIYERIGCKCVFPLIDNIVTKDDIISKISSLEIEIPKMYQDGFAHNNCNGGCVRAGKKQWVSLYNTYPDIYKERERVELEFTKWNNKRTGKNGVYHFMKDISLTELREIIENQGTFDFLDDDYIGECIGICGDMA